MRRIFCVFFVAIAGLAFLAAAADSEPADVPLATRTLYAPGHFGNSYECLGEREYRDLLVEWRDWGFNEYADWYDTIDCADPFSDPHNNMGRALWNIKKRNFKTAQLLGLPCVLVVTPNHVFLDQLNADYAATKKDRIFGQLVCPSTEGGRNVILANYRNWFQDLARAGVQLHAISAAPYDYGGCACDDCQPWILTFAKLCREIHAIAEESHPGVEMRFIGWWWSEEEHRLFADWADAEAPGWVRSMALHILYGEDHVSDVPLPQGCERQAFVHIGYADEAQPKDVYAHLGPVIAADRLQRTIAALEAQGCTGWMAYSEGVYDDVNKALLAGLSTKAFADPNGVLRAYAARYLDAREGMPDAWAAWLYPWGRPYVVDTETAAAAYKNVGPALPSQNWRLEQWRLKLELMKLNTAIVAETEWTDVRLAAVESFWATRERLLRDVYGLGPQRHILANEFSPVPWRQSWENHIAASASSTTAISHEQ
ncbi:MAG: hypothetical protein KJ060_13950 [Candidatus Hydrogenedentes bacterium]|nr:hypothetical protein [Candidatus Hydrogenedentota bacterium]